MNNNQSKPPKIIGTVTEKIFETKHEKHAEVKMIAGIGKMLAKNFGQDNVVTQGWQKKKAN